VTVLPLSSNGGSLPTFWCRETERWISEEQWRGERKKRLKRMRKAEVGFEFEEDGD
jgi:hypothetical protein